jgi:hypothetical protein
MTATCISQEENVLVVVALVMLMLVVAAATGPVGMGLLAATGTSTVRWSLCGNKDPISKHPSSDEGRFKTSIGTQGRCGKSGSLASTAWLVLGGR